MADTAINRSVSRKMRAQKEAVLRAYALTVQRERRKYSEAHGRLAYTAMQGHIALPEEEWEAKAREQMESQIKSGGSLEHARHVIMNFQKLIPEKCDFTSEEKALFDSYFAMLAKLG